MYSLASDARKTTGPSRSLGRPGRRTGMRSTRVRHPFRIVVHHLVLIGLEPARRQAVHGDAVRPPVVGQAHRQLPDAAAARAVRAEAGVAVTEVTDPMLMMRPRPCGIICLRDRLGDEERAAQVGVEDQVPVVPRDVDAPACARCSRRCSPGCRCADTPSPRRPTIARMLSSLRTSSSSGTARRPSDSTSA